MIPNDSRRVVETEITILTVVYDRQTTSQLNLNGKLVSLANSGTNYKWIVGVNKKPAHTLETSNKYFDKIVECYDTDHVYFRRRWGRSSLQHGMAINKLLRYVNTRYVLVLDPDFYVFEDDWISKIYDHVRSKELIFFGSTWDPRNYKKYRYFPSVQFFLIDLLKVDSKGLDFRPDVDVEVYKARKINNDNFFIKVWLKGLMLQLMKRKTIGISRDTGYRIYREYSNNKLYPQETLRPVHAPYSSNEFWSKTIFTLRQIYEKLFPEERRFVVNMDTVSTETWADFGGSETYKAGFQEFFWQNRFFALHMANTQAKRHTDMSIDVEKWFLDWQKQNV